MSFSSTVKNELCRLEPACSSCLAAELAAAIRFNGAIEDDGQGQVNIRVVTENAAFARRVYSSIKKICGIYPGVVIRKSRKLKKHVSYILVLKSTTETGRLLDLLDIKMVGKAGALKPVLLIGRSKIIKKSCCRKAFLRGAFLAAGSISDPEKTYHLEIGTHSRELAEDLNIIMNHHKLNAKIIMRKGSHVNYLKEGENIADFLNITGAHTALMEFENIRIMKDMRNSVNRIVNCETANLEKTVNASLRQVENIKLIEEKIGFDKIPENLREIAELRLEYSEASLQELGQLLARPLGKSGVNHRLRKLDEIAEEYRTFNGRN